MNSNINMEFNVKFDNEDYIITLQSILNDKLLIIIEDEINSIYWKKELDENIVSNITSQMGSYKSLEVFSKMLIAALSNQNENISLNFCSLQEIQQITGNNNINNNSLSNTSSNSNLLKNNSENIKKYLLLIYTQFEKVIFPIQLEYLDKNANPDILQRTIARLKNQIRNNKLNSTVNSNLSMPINYNEYEKLKEENLKLKNTVILLEKNRQLGAVENDDIYKNYSELNEEYEKYKTNAENRIKMLTKSLEELKENQFKESKNSFYEKGKNKNKIIDLEKKLEIASDIVANERKQGAKFIDEKNKEIENLHKEIRFYKENEKTLKAKISRLEKELERKNKENSYYRFGTPKSSKSYRSAGSYSNSYMSGFSKKTTTSYLKKNLIPNNPYDKYKGLRGKNYKPFSFLDNKKKKTTYSNNSKKSKGSSIGSKSIKSGSNYSNSSAKKNYGGKYVSPYRYNKLPNYLNGRSGSNKGSKPNSKGKNYVNNNNNSNNNKYSYNSNINKKSLNSNNITTNNANKKMDVKERIGRLEKLINTCNYNK